nr:retrovirus-related Pol polyprotein from transposon TNT 1-94 [Tanacetum cinerariifolium]
KPSSGTTKPANPKVIASGMYAVNPKYIVPYHRDNRETPIPVPKKKHVTFRKPQSTTRITSKPDTSIKQPNVSVPLSTGVKPASRASKPRPKSNAWIYRRCLNFDSYDNRVFNSMNSGHPITCHVMSILQVVQIVLWYPKDSGFALTDFADADYAGYQDTRRSTSGSAQFLGSRLVSWSSKKQKSTAISTTEAEYIALSSCCKQALPRERFETLLPLLGVRQMSPETLKELQE